MGIVQYVDKREFDELKSERDALAAQVEVFKKIREAWHGLAINDAKTLIAFIEASDSTPSASLAQVWAEAGRAGFIYCAEKYGNKLFTGTEIRLYADRYANRIRQQSTGTWLKDSNVNGGRRRGGVE